MNGEAFVNCAFLPWQCIQAALDQTHPLIAYRAAIATARLKGHGKGMVDSEYPSFPCKIGHDFNRPASAEAKLKNTVCYRKAEGCDGNAIRPFIDDPHGTGEEVTGAPSRPK